MFSNKFYYTKLIVSLVIVLSSCIYSYVAGLSINPAFWQRQLEPEIYDGTELWVPHCKLVRGGNEFLIMQGKFTIGASGDIDKEFIGKKVSLTGKFVKGPPSYIEIKEIEMIPFEYSRFYIEIISLIVFCYVALLFVRIFVVKLRHIFEAK